ncbi:MAG: sel1 repeat family protein [Rhizobiaceae bacterium]|nr:sel1 repeat family protein [Rhizobiaceae bacterium]
MARFDATGVAYADMASTNKPEALFELGLVYATGRDGEEDMIAAHKWFNIAAFQGFELAKARREEIAMDMTKDQIAKAQRAAREWITQH